MFLCFRTDCSIFYRGRIFMNANRFARWICIFIFSRKSIPPNKKMPSNIYAWRHPLGGTLHDPTAVYGPPKYHRMYANNSQIHKRALFAHYYRFPTIYTR